MVISGNLIVNNIDVYNGGHHANLENVTCTDLKVTGDISATGIVTGSNIFKSWEFINLPKTGVSLTLSDNGTTIIFDPGMYLIMVKQNKGVGEADFLGNYTLAYVAITNEIDSNTGSRINYIFNGGSSSTKYNVFTHYNTGFPAYSIGITSLNYNPIDVKLYQLIM